MKDAFLPYTGKDLDVFLRGSYGSDTSVYAESNVDVQRKQLIASACDLYARVSTRACRSYSSTS